MFKCSICGKIIYANKYRYLSVLREHLKKEHGNPGGFVLRYFLYAKSIDIWRSKDRFFEDIKWIKACDVFPCY